jgi:hypothetical protein
MQSSGWKYDYRLHHLNAAQSWGLPSPEDFDKLSKSSKVDILAWYEVKWRIDAINSYELQRKAESDARRKRKKK